MANRRQFLRTLAGAAALSVTADVSSFGRVRKLRLSAAMPDTAAHDRLQPEWYQRKIRQVQQEMQKRKLNTLLLLDSHNVIYTTGYFHLSTERDRKSTRLNSSHRCISYAVFCLKKKT